MRLTERITLIGSDGAERHTVGLPMLPRGSQLEEAGVRIELGGLQIVVDSQGVTNEWNVRYRGREYGVLAVTPFLKKKYPRRDVLTCELLTDV